MTGGHYKAGFCHVWWYYHPKVSRQRGFEMALSVSRTQMVRFGTYEADLRGGELRKAGSPRPLPQQPFQVLAILLEHQVTLSREKNCGKRLCPMGPLWTSSRPECRSEAPTGSAR